MRGASLLIGIPLLSACIASGITYAVFSHTNKSAVTDQELRSHTYRTMGMTEMSPYTLRNMLDKGDDSFVLVDLRDVEAYTEEHIVSALSIPYDEDSESMVNIFRDLSLRNPSKTIVVYDVAASSEHTYALSTLLASNDIYIQRLAIGWNEWRYYWTLWNPKDDWDSTYSEDYLWRGPDPGIPNSQKTE